MKFEPGMQLLVERLPINAGSAANAANRQSLKVVARAETDRVWLRGVTFPGTKHLRPLHVSTRGSDVEIADRFVRYELIGVVT